MPTITRINTKSSDAPPKCDYCERTDGVVQLVAIGRAGRLDVQNAWLHQACEQGYLRMIDE